MLVCPKCKTENRIGAIFCRDCGEQLDVADMRPPSRKERGGGGFGWGKLIRLLVVLAILGAIGYAGVEIFTPLELEVAGVPPARAEAIWREYERLSEQPTGERMVLDSAEATMLFNRILALDEEGLEASGGAMAPQKIVVELLPDNTVKAVIRYRVFNRFVSDSVLIGRISVPEGSTSPRFEPHTYRIGRLPMKWFLQDIVVGRFQQQFSGRPDFERVRGRIQELQVSQNQVRIVAQEPEPATRRTESARPADQPARGQGGERGLGDRPSLR